MEPMYEEKTFENFFNAELSRKSAVYFPFGQVQEGCMGADAAAYSPKWPLWDELGFPRRLAPRMNGVDLPDVARYMERGLRDAIRNIPKIKVNLIFQYKRPEFLKNSQAAEWKLWKRPYFRYDIYKKQQKLLMRLHSQFGRKALVLYASPAINDVDELVSAQCAGTIIQNTNFRPVDRLDMHHRNTYIKSGLDSKACSNPEYLEPFDLLATLQEFRTEPDADNVQAISSFMSSTFSIAIEDEYLGDAFRMLMEPYRERGITEYKLVYGLLAMQALRDLSGIQWMLAVDEVS